MSKRLELKPDGFPLKLLECPPGFFLKDDDVCFKSKYAHGNETDERRSEAFCETGCYFWGGKEGDELGVDNVIVQPLIVEWVDT